MRQLSLSQAQDRSAMERAIAMDRQAAIYAEYRGWDKPDKRGRYFNWKALAGKPTRKAFIEDLPPYCDHTWFFKVGRKPVAMVTFPYQYVKDECEAFALANGLKFDVETGFPNWYGYRTFMIVWTRGGSDETNQA